MCVYQAEPHQGLDKHVCPRMEKDSGRAGYWITILGQELLMHVRKKGKREKKSFWTPVTQKIKPTRNLQGQDRWSSQYLQHTVKIK